MLEAQNLTKEFDSGGRPLLALRDVVFTIPQGDFVAVVGPSGSGKTTLLGLLAGLDTPTRGKVILDGTEITRLSEDERARLRGEKVGFMFQNFQLIPSLTAQENVQVPLELAPRSGRTRAAETRARDVLARVGLAERAHHFPAQLYGGEQQRVALARAFVNEPRILFADEPTGNLDGRTGERIIELIESLNRESGATVVLVTHEARVASRASRMIRLADGAVVEDALAQPDTADLT
jgi:putative ABC transport system ATP-binding protein